MHQSIPKPSMPPRTIPGHLTHVMLRAMGNLTQNGAIEFRVKTFVIGRKQKYFAIL